MALAKRFVASLDTPTAEETGRIYVQAEATPALASAVKALAKDGPLLGLKVEPGVPASPDGPALALTDRRRCRQGQGRGRRHAPPTARAAGPTPASSPCRFSKKDGKLDAPALLDAAAEGLLGKLVEARLVKAQEGPGKAKDTYTVQILNRSPLILNGLAMRGPRAGGPQGHGPGGALGALRRSGARPDHRRAGPRRSSGSG